MFMSSGSRALRRRIPEIIVGRILMFKGSVEAVLKSWSWCDCRKHLPNQPVLEFLKIMGPNRQPKQ